MRTYVYLCICLIAMQHLSAQSYSGLELDNFSGINSLTFNPANVVDSRFRADINIATVGSTITTDYFGINLSNLIDNPDGFDFDEDSQTFPSQANNLYLNLDVLGPSFMFNLAPKHALGITTRVRAFMNVNRINGSLYETLSEDDAFDNDINIDMENLNGTIHAWTEAGLTYGMVLYDGKNHFLKGGITLKYLQGAGAVFFNSDRIQGNYDAAGDTITANGDLTYGQTLDDTNDENDEFKFGSGSSGFAADFGLMYEYRPNLGDIKMDSTSLKGHNQYRFKLGLSLQDMGKLSYENVNVEEYVISGTVSADDFEEDFQQGLEDNYDQTSTVQNVDLQLPTTLRYMADYRINRNLYLGLSGVLSLNDDTSPLSNRRLNYMSIVPRYESRLFSLYTNLSVMEYSDFIWGAGFRFCLLTVGSGSIISNLITDDSRAADVYAGVKIPILQSRYSKETKQLRKEERRKAKAERQKRKAIEKMDK
ncbi:hypothetical protein A9Q93_01775 [Nonlabens dokdonensis]|uniref:DUF5723 domain-containing protein n=2 Tax=Nonlabens dokdonensis TaxID=328515 RepID=A0A1Z8BC42_9FLAO|nr:hypothetical protein A9Q93_01775 [Nonlabens dokdonensis]